MNHSTISGVVAIVAVIAAAAVDISGGDSLPYISLAAATVGYATGNAVEKVRKRKS